MWSEYEAVLSNIKQCNIVWCITLYEYVSNEHHLLMM